MATPRYGFRAHDSGGLYCYCEKLAHTVFEIRCLHIVGITSETGIPPALVNRVFARMAQAAQGRNVMISDVARRECRTQWVTIELGSVARPRYGANINQYPN